MTAAVQDRRERLNILLGIHTDSSTDFGAWDEHTPTDADLLAAERIDSLVSALHAAFPIARYTREQPLQQALASLANAIPAADTVRLVAAKADTRHEASEIRTQAPSDMGAAHLLAGLAAHNAIPDALPPGTMLRDYRIDQCLGQGGMGTVYRAVQVNLNRPVAVKLLAPWLSRQTRFRSRFAREMQAVGRLDHPHIVRALDAGDSEHGQFLAMEYVDGEDLASLLARRKRLRIADACEIARQIAAALRHVQEAGLVHRDVKPSNIMLARNGTAKLLDLGLARLESDAGDPLTNTGQMMGTVDYMAPEQAADAATADIRADLYSLGCTLYALLAGEPPFSSSQHTTIPAKLRAHAETAPSSLAVLRPDLPPDLVALVHGLLAKRAADRPGSPAELAQSLALYCPGNDLPAIFQQDYQWRNAPQPVVRNDRSPPRRRLLVGMLCGGLAAAMLAGVFVIIRYTDKDGNPAQKVVEVPGTIRVLDIVEQPPAEPSPPKTPPAEVPPTPPLPAALFPERAVAEFLLKDGGMISVLEDSALTQPKYCKTVAELPRGYFVITEAYGSKSLTDETITKLSPCVSLQTLDLSNCGDLTDVGFQKLKNLPRLRVLVLSRSNENGEPVEPKIKDDSIEHAAAAFPALTGVYLPTTATNRSLIALGKVKAMESIVASGLQISDEGVTAVARNKNLISLVLWRCSVGDESLEVIGNNSRLEALHIESDHITDKGAQALAGCTKLTELRLTSRSLTGAPLAKLIKLPKLQDFEYSRAIFTLEQLQAVGEFPPLRNLEMHRTNFSDEMAVVAEQMRKIKSLTMRFTQLSPAARERLLKNLPDTTCLIDNAR